MRNGIFTKFIALLLAGTMIFCNTYSTSVFADEINEVVFEDDADDSMDDAVLNDSDIDKELSFPTGGLMPLERVDSPDFDPSEIVYDVDEIGDAILELAEDGKDISGTEYIEKYVDSQVYSHEWDKYSNNYIYNHLSDEGKLTWDALDATCRKILEDTTKSYTYTEAVKTNFTDEAKAEDFIFMFKYSNPQYYFLSNRWGGYYSSGEISFYLYIYENMVAGASRAAAKTSFESGINRMKSKITYSSDEETYVKNIHDTICKSVSYNQASVDNKHENEQTEYTQSAYSTFTLGTTVCAGYALAMELLCNDAGIDCIGVTSPGHAYNKVKVYDSWYNIDATWADQSDGIYYGYYLKSDSNYAEGSTSHIVNPEYDAVKPPCNQNSTSYRWSYGGVAKPSDTVETPVLTKSGDDITITCGTPGVTIYYTMDGTNPASSYTKSLIYKGAFLDVEDKTVKAIAVKEGMWDSDVGTLYRCPHSSFETPVVTKATATTDGSSKRDCSDCDYVEETRIPKASNITLSQSEYTYDGSDKQPTVTLRNSNNALISSSEYSVSYMNNINAGEATARITFKADCERYTGTADKKFTIKKASQPAQMPENMNATIDTGKKVSDVDISHLTDWVFADADKNRTLPTRIGDSLTVTMNYTGADKSNYVITSKTIVITMSSCSGHVTTSKTENRIDSTCTLAGSYDEVYTCTKCHTETNRINRTIPAKGHDMASYYTSNNDGTCIADGTKSKHCLRSGCAYSETIADIGSKNANNHAGVLSKTDQLNPTTTTYGCKAYWTCNSCGISYKSASAGEANKIGDDAALEIWKSDLAMGRIDKLPLVTITPTPTPTPTSTPTPSEETIIDEIIPTDIPTVTPEQEYTQPIVVDKTNPNKMAVTVVKGGVSSTIYDIAKHNGEKIWKVVYSGAKVASISKKGVIKGVKEGQVTANVITEHGEYIIKIDVENPKFSKGTIVLNNGDFIDSGFYGTGLEVNYSILKPSVASVDSKTGRVTALSYGKTKVIAYAGGKKYSRVVQVYDPFIFGKSTVKVNKKLKLSVKKGVKKTYDWTSSDTSVATVDSKGNVVGISPGEVTISAVNNGVKMEVEIIVLE